MIVLDYKDRRPIYEQVAERLQELMLLGILEQDEKTSIWIIAKNKTGFFIFF